MTSNTFHTARFSAHVSVDALKAPINNPFIKKQLEKAFNRNKKAEKKKGKFSLKKDSIVDYKNMQPSDLSCILTPRPRNTI